MSVKALSVLLLAGLAAPALSQSFGETDDVGIEIAPEKEIRFFATGNAKGYTPTTTRGPDSGKLSSFSIDTFINADIPIDEDTDLTVSFGQTSTTYDFENYRSFNTFAPVDPMNYGIRVTLDARFTHDFADQWSIFGGGNLNSTGEVGAELEKTITFGGFFGVMHHFHEDLSAGIALAGFSKLEDDFAFFPIPTVRWQIDDYWRLDAGYTPTDGKPGVEITYHIDENWEVGGSLTYDFKQYRLENDNSILPGGAMQDEGFPLMFITTWKPEPNFKLSGLMGVMAYREIKLRTSSEGGAGRSTIEPSFGVGVSAEFTF